MPNTHVYGTGGFHHVVFSVASCGIIDGDFGKFGFLIVSFHLGISRKTSGFILRI